MWALGCIIIELCAKLLPDKNKGQKVLFKGSSCFPISPISSEDNGEEVIVDSDD